MNTLVELSSVSYKYDNIIALENISLTIKEGELILLTGPNGCGKSTLFKLLNGLVFPSSGKYFFAGQEITPKLLKDNLSAKKFHQQIGYVFQNPDLQLFNPTVYDEIAFGPRQMQFDEDKIRERTDSLLCFLHIEHLRDRVPYHLSGGEKKKVSIAAVLALNPDIIMMDEPLNGLDKKARKWVENFIIDFSAAGKTMLIASHEEEIFTMQNRRTVQLDENHQLVL
ncbi:energy-coupling factor ABC transporter ATP-binding protein [Pectinatus haikarae]|uniref:Cobalt/nickel transport system ATP-binding protein n=1 Tax=Pectinatus haikarae TaxID=349096 RepID=A0ABT9YDQ6_9FIRM|nr:ABC transporter ATP-binding protein [Pectinatus haikarae]MDQ0205169.1 cobalt/nickel transport system ATP-binding protein [Pectinatus haikarae]